MEEEYAKIALKDALESIHKVVTVRLGVISISMTLITGTLAYSVVQKALVFLLAAMFFTLLAIILEQAQQQARWAYYSRYLQVAHKYFKKSEDYWWLATFNDAKRLKSIANVITGEHSNAETNKRLRLLISPKWHHSATSIVGLLMLGAQAIGFAFAVHQCWRWLPR